MTTVAAVLLRHKLIPASVVEQCVRWGLPMPAELSEEENEFSAVVEPTLDAVLAELYEASEEPGREFGKDTSLGAVREYLSTMELMKVHLVEKGVEVVTPTIVGRTGVGEFLIPWKSDSITELLTNGDTYLERGDGSRVYLGAIREFYYGAQKSFLCGTVSKTEGPDGKDPS